MSRFGESQFGIYLDDSLFDYELIDALVAEGYRVITPLDAGPLGARDRNHFDFAAAHGLVLLTKNPKDFVSLHEDALGGVVPPHSGIFAVYQDNDPTRDMSPGEIARAISNLLAAGVPIAGEFHTLNHWRY